jgi:hypothetical protein
VTGTTDLWQELSARLHPVDLEGAPAWQRHYETKYAVAARLRPRSICEIGVRGGYSALAFLLACPDSFVLGIDDDSATHGGMPGMLGHARCILAGRPFALMVYSSQALPRLPFDFDLVHVDGDHSYAGTLHDLRLAWDAGRAVLIDDYHSIPSVGQACDDFFGPRGVTLEHLDDKQVLALRDPQLASLWSVEGGFHDRQRCSV